MKSMNQKMSVFVMSAGLVSLGLFGCTTAGSVIGPKVATNGEGPTSQESTESTKISESTVDSDVGTIVRVNNVDRYVIVDCRRLPSPGEEAKVVRNHWQAGTIRFSGPRHRPFASADIVNGQPEVGDLVLP